MEAIRSNWGSSSEPNFYSNLSRNGVRMQFKIHLTPAEEGGYVVTFPDVPEAITQGDTEEEALRNGLDALITALDFYFEDRRTVPIPRVTSGERYIHLPQSVVARSSC